MNDCFAAVWVARYTIRIFMVTLARTLTLIAMLPYSFQHYHHQGMEVRMEYILTVLCHLHLREQDDDDAYMSVGTYESKIISRLVSYMYLE